MDGLPDIDPVRVAALGINPDQASALADAHAALLAFAPQLPWRVQLVGDFAWHAVADVELGRRRRTLTVTAARVGLGSPPVRAFSFGVDGTSLRGRGETLESAARALVIVVASLGVDLEELFGIHDGICTP